MSTLGPVSMRPDDDILFTHKEEDLLLRMDRESELGRARNMGVDVVSVARVGGRNGGVAGGGGGGGRNSGAGGGQGVTGGFFGSGGGSIGKGSGGVRSGGVQPAPPPPPAATSYKKPISPPSVPPPAYSSISRHRDTLVPANGGGKAAGPVHGRASIAGSRRPEDSAVEGSSDRMRASGSSLPQGRNRQTR